MAYTKNVSGPGARCTGEILIVTSEKHFKDDDRLGITILLLYNNGFVVCVYKTPLLPFTNQTVISLDNKGALNILFLL